MEKPNLKIPHISLPIVVEGKYDRSAILGMFSGTVITTDGFGIFNSKEKQALLRRVSKNGIILLTDPDGAGKQIRSFLSGILPKEKIYQLYIPRVPGKEKRKTRASKEGILGVEGVGAQTLKRLLEPFVDNAPERASGGITKTDLYVLGLSGGENSSRLRDAVSVIYELPCGMSANALLAALNIITTKDELEENVLKVSE